jgi:hypothetical protein
MIKAHADDEKKTKLTTTFIAYLTMKHESIKKYDEEI